MSTAVKKSDGAPLAVSAAEGGAAEGAAEGGIIIAFFDGAAGFASGFAAGDDGLVARLKQDGACVVRSALPAQAAEALGADVAQVLEQVFGPAQQQKSVVVGATALMHHGLAWCQPAVDARVALAPLFGALWRARLLPPPPPPRSGGGSGVCEKQEEELLLLLCAAEGLAPAPPADADADGSPRGLLALRACEARVIARSHRVGARFVRRFRSSPSPKATAKKKATAMMMAARHVPRTDAEAAFYHRRGARAVAVRLAPGDVLLYDARLLLALAPHAPDALPVAMAPRALATAGDLARKRRAFETLRCTTPAAAAGVELRSAAPRVHGLQSARRNREARPIAAPPVLSPFARALFGAAEGGRAEEEGGAPPRLLGSQCGAYGSSQDSAIEDDDAGSGSSGSSSD